MNPQTKENTNIKCQSYKNIYFFLNANLLNKNCEKSTETYLSFFSNSKCELPLQFCRFLESLPAMKEKYKKRKRKRN